MVVQPFKGFDREYWDENGWAFAVHARAGRWELREFVQQQPVQGMIAATASLLAAEAALSYSEDGWVVGGNRQPVVDHTLFSTPVEAFHWWVTRQI